VSDRLVRFPGSSWQEIEALPQPLRWTVQRTIFHLLDEPVPTLADPFLRDDPLPGSYELHLPADDVTIWYTVTQYEGREVRGTFLTAGRRRTTRRIRTEDECPTRLI
jgi:hypothetical protein